MSPPGTTNAPFGVPAARIVLGLVGALHLLGTTGLAPAFAGTRAALLSALVASLVLPAAAWGIWQGRRLVLAEAMALPVPSLLASSGLWLALRAFSLSASAAATLTSAVLIAAYFAACWRSRGGRLGFSRSQVGWALGGALLSALLMVPANSDRVAVSWHGFFHAAITEQVITTGLPPSNPGCAGEILNYNYGFHALIAPLTAASGVHPTRVILLLNLSLLLFTLLTAMELGRLYLDDRRGPGLVAAGTVGAINLAAPAWLLWKRIQFGELRSNEFTAGKWIDWLAQRAIPGNDEDIGRALWDVRASTFVKEFHDVSGMACGIYLLTLAGVLGCRLVRGERGGTAWMLGAALFLLALVYPPLALAAWAEAGVLALLLLVRPRAPGETGRARVLVQCFGPLALATLLSIPYLLSVTAETNWSEAADPFLSLRFTRKHWTLPAAFLGQAPLLLLGLVWWWRRRREMAAQGALLLLVTLASMNTFLFLQQGSQYKFLYGMAPWIALFSAAGFEELLTRWQRAPRRLLTGLMVILSLGPVAVFEIGLLTSTDYSDPTFAVTGRHVVHREDSAWQDCLIHVRDHAPRDAVLVVPPEGDHKSPSNAGFEVAAMSERAVLVVLDHFHAERFQSFAARLRVTEQLLAGEDIEGATRALDELVTGPTCLVLPRFDRAVLPEYVRAGWTSTFASGPAMVLTRESGHGLAPALDR